MKDVNKDASASTEDGTATENDGTSSLDTSTNQDQGGNDNQDSQTTLPGDKTPSHLLLQSLQEERAENRRLREENENLRGSRIEQNDDAQDGATVDTEAREQLSKLNTEIKVRDVMDKYPVLKDHRAKFDEYRAQYPDVEVESVAKLFISDNNLGSTRRKGLEDSTGGPRQSTESGYTREEVEEMRTNNWRKFSRLVKEGKIKVNNS